MYEHGVKKAQEIAREGGLTVGQIVGHPDDETAYELKKIKGKVGVVWLPGQEDTIKEFPFDELYDPNVAMREAIKQKHFEDEISEDHPEILN